MKQAYRSVLRSGMLFEAKLRMRQKSAPLSGPGEARVENGFAKEKREAKADIGTTAFQ